jgi:hypothetical protein
VEEKDKIFATKWDSLCKHAGQRKAKRNYSKEGGLISF